MEHKIGEVFKFKGKKIKPEIIANHYSCEGCVFDGCDGCLYFKEYCSYGYRKDGNDVIFVEVK